MVKRRHGVGRAAQASPRIVQWAGAWKLGKSDPRQIAEGLSFSETRQIFQFSKKNIKSKVYVNQKLSFLNFRVLFISTEPLSLCIVEYDILSKDKNTTLKSHLIMPL